MAPPFLDDTSEAFLLAHCHRRQCQPKEMVLHGGSAGDTLIYLVKGVAKVSVINSQGQEMIITYLGPGEFAGEHGIFCPDLPRSAWVTANTRCDVATISYSAFHELANKRPALLYALGRQLSSRLVKTTQRASDFAFRDVVGRIRRCLKELTQLAVNARHEGLTIHYTRQELAMMAGCTREMAGRALKILEQEGLVRVQGKRIEVSQALIAAEEVL